MTPAQRLVWRTDLGPCAVCPHEGERCQGPVEGHHVIDKQQLVRMGLLSLLADRRIRLPVCQRRHMLHTKRLKPIPWRLLPKESLEVANEINLLWWMEKRYPKDDA